MKIRVGFSKPINKCFPIFSWLIRLFDGFSPYSHVYVRWYSNKLQRWITYEASGSSVNFIGEKVFNQTRKEIHYYEIVVNEEDTIRFQQYCVDTSGTKYGILQLFGIALARILRLKRNPFADNEATQVCSEAAGLLLKNVLKYNIKLELDLATPRDIDKYLESQGFIKNIQV